MKNQSTMTAEEFLQALVKNKGTLTHSSLTVKHDVRLNGKEHRIESLHLEQVTFTGSLTIQNFEKLDSVCLGQVECFRGLLIENVSCRHLAMTNAKVDHLHVWRCISHVVTLHCVEVSGSFELYGIHAMDHVTLNDISCCGMELWSPRTYDRLTAPYVTTDDPVIARQLELAGIPVIVPTQVVKAMLQTEPVYFAQAE